MKIVKCDHSLAHTPFGTQQKCDIHRRTLFGLQSEIVNFGYSLSRTLFGTQPECD